MGKLTIEHLTKAFEDTVAVADVSFSVDDGELVTVVGPSGCGKTTLLRMIAGFTTPTVGRILIDKDVYSDQPVRKVDVRPENRGIGMVFQSYAVWPHMNVFGNVAYPLKLRKLKKEEIRQEVSKALSLVRLEGYEERMPYEMSGGQQQRVALARALVMQPRLLLLDEPLSNLDTALREEMREEIKDIQHRVGITIVNVTHDQTEAMSMSDRVALMRDGKLIQYDTPKVLYDYPANSFVARFIGSANCIPDGKGYRAFRAHEVTVDENGPLRGRITQKNYLGDHFEYKIALMDGTTIRMRQPRDEEYRPGTEVRLRVLHEIRLKE